MSAPTRLTRRRAGSREEKVSILIVCEGITEELYFSGMRRRGGPAIHTNTPGCDHETLLVEAENRKCDEYTEVWCVLDTELDTDLTRRLVVQAKRSGIRLALSAPCFELWLILHKTDHRRPFQSATEAKRLLRDLLPGWSESNTEYSCFASGVDKACSHARALDPSGENHLKNPSSNVWKLVELLR